MDSEDGLECIAMPSKGAIVPLTFEYNTIEDLQQSFVRWLKKIQGLWYQFVSPRTSIWDIHNF